MVMDQRRPATTDFELLQAVSATESPVLSTTEFAEEFSYSPPGMEKRLNKLRDSGLLDTRLTGGVRIWWLTDDGEAYLDGELDTNELEQNQ